eukprot:209898-Hanusia_phi.AAC.1
MADGGIEVAQEGSPGSSAREGARASTQRVRLDMSPYALTLARKLRLRASLLRPERPRKDPMRRREPAS